VIQKFPGANTQDVTKGVEQALAELGPGLPNVQVDPNVYQANTYIQSALHNLGTWALIAMALLLLVLVIALQWRTALIVFVAVSLSLVAAAVALYLAGTTFNLMVLVGLAAAVGIVIDDAVADVRAIRGGLRDQRGGGAAPFDVVAGESRHARGAMGYATLIALLLPLPFVFEGGVAGAFAKPLVLAYSVAVLASTVVALTVAPGMALMLLRNELSAPPGNRPVRRVRTWFESAAGRYLRQPLWGIAALGALLLAAGAAAPQLNAAPALPSLQDRSLLVHLETMPATSLPEMVRITTTVAGEVQTVPGVQRVGAHVGRAVTSDQTVDVNSGELWVRMADSADYNATVSSIRRVLRGYPGVHSDLLTYPEDRVSAAGSGIDGAFVVRIYGLDLDVMQRTAEEVRSAISSVQGVVYARVQVLPEEPTLDVEVNLSSAQRYGLNPGDVRRAATTYFSGLMVGSLYEEQKVFDVVVMGSPSRTASPSDVANLLLDTPSGGQVRLGDVANVHVAAYPTVIKHDATLRSIDVTADVNGRALDAVLSDVKRHVQTVNMPLEYHAEVLSDLSTQQGQDLRVVGLAIAAALAILLVLQAAFGSWRLAAMVFLTIPLAAAGGVLAALVLGGVMTLGALAGLLAVLGIATRNSILLIRGMQRLASVAGTSRQDAVLQATREDLGHILLTAALTAVVLLPLLVLGRVAGTEVLYPMAVVVLGGLITSTVFTVFVVPALYLLAAPAPLTTEEGLI
jgi:Cu/Ag efflux pump CusA